MKRYTVEDIGRIYVDDDDRWYTSVSTILDHRPKPEALVNWLQNTENADEINRFKRNRGTIIHYECLNPLYQESIGDPDADMWSQDEADSKKELQREGKWGRAQEGVEWALETFELIRDLYNIDHILDVETYVKHIDVNFAGQFDLLYQDMESNETVLADIKTGKSVYTKNQDQLSAYAHAVPISVDRVEVIRMNPDNRDWYVASDPNWDRSLETCWQDFVDTQAKFSDEKLDEFKEEIRQLVETGSVSAEHDPTAA